MTDAAVAWRSATFAHRVSIGTALVVGVIVALVQGVHVFRPGVCVNEIFTPWRALPWLVLAAVPSIIYFSLKAIATRAPRIPSAVGAGPYRSSVADTSTQFRSPPAHHYVRGVVVLLTIGMGAAQSRTWSCALALPASCHPTLKKIVLVPVGAIPPSLVSSLQKHFSDCYSLPISVGAAVTPPSGAFDQERKQWIAEGLLDATPACKTDDSTCDTLTIGVTDYDIYMSEYATQFNWIYTARNDARHVEIVSTFRMPLSESHLERASKIIARDIALDYCGLPLSDNLHSVLTPRLTGQNNLDEIDESIW